MGQQADGGKCDNLLVSWLASRSHLFSGYITWLARYVYNFGNIYLLFSSPWADQALMWERRRVGGCGSLTAWEEGEEAFVEHPDCDAEEGEGSEGRWVDFCWISEAVEIHVRCT